MAATGTLPQLLTIDQLAERLGTSIRHVRRLVAEKRVPYLKVRQVCPFRPRRYQRMAGPRAGGRLSPLSHTKPSRGVTQT
jgi:excisionase family DNA binding protein